MNYNKIIPFLKEIGVTTPTEEMELRWLFRHASHCTTLFGNAKIVELGTLNTASAIVIGAAIQHSMSMDTTEKRVGHLTSVDNYAAADRGNPLLFTFEEAKEKIELANMSDVITLVKSDANEYLAQLEPLSIHMLWIDALHTYKHVIKNLNLGTPALVDRALLCGHDYCYQGPGVVEAVEEFKITHAKTLCGFGTFWKIWWTLINKPAEI